MRKKEEIKLSLSSDFGKYLSAKIYLIQHICTLYTIKSTDAKILSLYLKEITEMNIEQLSEEYAEGTRAKYYNLDPIKND